MKNHYTYLILGGGMTAASAVQGIREIDPGGSIGLISAEPHEPYDRPLLTKGLWKGKEMDEIWREIDGPPLDFHLGRIVQTLDPQGKRLVDDRGNEYTYEKLLLATGGTPRKLPYGREHILYYRTVDDYKMLRSMTGEGVRFGVIGGGFIGWEITAALAMNDQQVVIIFPEHGIGARLYPFDLSIFLNQYYRDKGVEVKTKQLVEGLEKRGDEIALTLNSGEEIMVDHVVAGIGIRPNTELAESAGLTVDDGIVVDEYLRTDNHDIYAAGDVARFYNPALDQHLRVEHEDNANSMGKNAGINMATHQFADYDAESQLIPYHYLPFYYSDLFDLGYEAVGDLDSSLEIVEDWEERFQKGVVYYMNEGRVRGVLLWNVWGKVDLAREIIAQPGPWAIEYLKGIWRQESK